MTTQTADKQDYKYSDVVAAVLKKFPNAKKVTQERFPQIDLRSEGKFLVGTIEGSRIQKTSNGPATILQWKLVETNSEITSWDREAREQLPVKAKVGDMIDLKATTVLMSVLDHPMGTKFLVAYEGLEKPEKGNEYHNYGIFVIPAK